MILLSIKAFPPKNLFHVLAIPIFFVCIAIYSQIEPIFNVDIRDATAADNIILNKRTSIPHIFTVRDLFSDKYGERPPTPQMLGKGYVIDDDSPYTFYLISPCIWYEIHAKELSGLVPPEHLVIKRWVLDTATAAWNSDGERSTKLIHTTSLIGINQYDGDYSFFYGVGLDDDAVNIDPPRIKATLFSDFYLGKPIDSARKRTNFLT